MRALWFASLQRLHREEGERQQDAGGEGAGEEHQHWRGGGVLRHLLRGQVLNLNLAGSIMIGWYKGTLKRKPGTLPGPSGTAQLKTGTSCLVSRGSMFWIPSTVRNTYLLGLLLGDYAKVWVRATLWCSKGQHTILLRKAALIVIHRCSWWTFLDCCLRPSVMTHSCFGYINCLLPNSLQMLPWLPLAQQKQPP